MFRVTFMCQDNKLGHAVRALVGISVETPQVQAVVGATMHRNKVVAREGGSTLKELLLTRLRAEGLKVITSQAAADLTQELGYQRLSAAKTLQDLTKEGYLKRIDRGQYQVTSR